MLSKKALLNGLRLLELHFNKELNQEIIPIWYEFLNRELSEDEFFLGVKEAILECQFFPTAKQLVEFAQMGNETKSMYEWRMVIVPAAVMGSLDGKNYLLNQLSQRGRIALQLIGGIDKVGLTEEKWLDNLSKEFKKAYCQTILEKNILPPVKTISIEHKEGSSFERMDGFEAINSTLTSTTLNPAFKRIAERIKMNQVGTITKDNAYRFALSINGWKINDERFNYFMESVVDKTMFLENFKALVRRGKSPLVAFDKLSDYKAPPFSYDVKALANEWLEDVEF
jgi:hypothetical protein